MNKTIHAYISGKVQGVWYRDSTISKAQQMGINGWVRNRADGRVEMIAQGSSENIQKLIDWCWQGPQNARVDGVEYSEICDVEDLSDFIRRPTA